MIIRQLLQAVTFLHDHGIFHRDIKLENVMLEQFERPGQLHIKLTDFGFASNFRNPSNVTMSYSVGTPEYMAPEFTPARPAIKVPNFIGSASWHTEKVDVWASGVLAFLLLSRKHPFKRDG